MAEFPPCPQCNSEFTYQMDALFVCPECAHEWDPSEKNIIEDIKDSKLLDKLIEITQVYEKPIIIYGVGIPTGARNVYMRKGFRPQMNENGLQFIINS